MNTRPKSFHGILATSIATLLTLTAARAVDYNFGSITENFTLTATDQARALPGGTASGVTFNDSGFGGVYDRGSDRDATYMHFDLSSIAGGTINGTVNLNFTIDATYGGAINGGIVGSATNAWSYPGTTGGITTISGADPSGSYTTGQTATAVIDNTTFQGFATNLGTFNGLAITAGSGSTAHFSGPATLTGNVTAGLVRVFGGTDWSAAAWNGGTSTLSISGASDVSGGAVTVRSGATIAVTGSATLGGGSFSGSFANSGVLSFGSSANQTLSGVISGSGSLSKSGAGTLTLAGSNSYTGGTTIDVGTVVAARSTLGTGAVVINNGGTLYANDQWVLCGANPYGVNERNIGTLTINAGGTLHLDSVNGFANGATNLYLNGGSVTGGANSDARGALYLYNGNEQITAGGATTSAIGVSLGVTGNNNTITVDSGSTLNLTNVVKNSDWNGNGSTPGGFIKAGTGTLTLSGGNSYSGQTNITAGTLVAANSTALGVGGFNGTSSTNISDGATLALQGNISLDEHMHLTGAGVGGLGALRNLSGNNALTMTNGNSGTGPGLAIDGNTTIGVDAGTLTVTGFYHDSGSHGITKVGAGTLTFSSNSTYTGGTTISEGTVITGGGGVGRGAVSIASGATLSTTSAASTGLAALYYNNSIDQANIASLTALLGHFGPNSTAPSLVNTASSMNFANNGSGFPSPYNSGASNFEAFYSGKVNIVTAGTYTFNASSDDGSMLFIDGQVVVTNNFFQGVTTRTGSISLTSGMHDIVIAFNQGGGGYGMNAQISGANDVNMVDINSSNASITPDLVVGSLAGAGSVVLSTGNLITGIDNSSTNFSGVISGIGGVTKFGTGTLTLSGSNTNTGKTTIAGGNVRFANTSGTATVANVELVAPGSFLIMDAANQFGSNAGLRFNSSGGHNEFALYGNNQTIASLASTNQFAVVQNSHGGFGSATASSTLTVNQSTNTTYSGLFRNNSGNDAFTLALVKTGSGMLTLATNTEHTGGTTVNGGVLEIAGSSGGNGYLRGTVTVNSGGELRYTGGDGTGFGYTGGNKIDTLNIVGGLVDSQSSAHLWGATLNMTGGELRANGGVSDPGGQQIQWNNTSANTFASATTATISGRVNLRGDGSYSSAAFNVADGAASTDLLVSAAITESSGSVGITKSGAGTMTLTGNNTYTGATNVNVGTLKLQGGAFSTTARDYSIASGAVLNLDGNTGFASGTTTIAGTGTLRITGGTFANEGPNSPVGPGRSLTMAMDGGAVIDVQSGAAMINGGWQAITWTNNKASLNMDGSFDVWDGNTVFVDALTGAGTVTGGGTQPLTVGVNNGSGAFSGVISGNIGLTKNGTGTQTLTGANSYSGTTTVSAGTLKLQGGAFSTTARDYSIASGAVLNLDGNTGIASGTTTLSGDGTLRVSGGSLENGAGSGRNINVNLGGGALIDIQAGGKIQNGGWQSMTWTNNLADMQVNGTLDVWDGNAVRVDALTGAGSVDKTHGGNSPTLLTVGVNDGGGTFTGTIANTAGQLAFTKSGTGTQVLSGANTFTGATTIEGGTLEVSGSLSGTTNVTVNTGGTLLLSGSGGTNTKLNTTATMDLAGGMLEVSDTISSTLDQTLGALTLSASSVIDFGTFASGNTFRFADSASLVGSWSGTLSIHNWTDGFDHLFFGNGGGTGLQPSQLAQIKFYSDAGSTILPFAPGFSGFTGGFGEVVPVPEPSSIATAMGLLGLVGWRERRKAQSTRRASRK